MKKIFLLSIPIILTTTLNAQSLILKENATLSYENGQKFDNISIENSNVSIEGKTKGIETSNLQLKNNSVLNINFKNNTDSSDPNTIPTKGLKIKDTSNNLGDNTIILIDKSSKLSINSFSNKPLDNYGENNEKGFGFSIANRANGLVIDSLYSGKKFVINGELDSKATAKAIDLSSSSNKRTLIFEKDSKLNAMGGFTAIDLENHDLIFKGNATLKGGSCAIKGSRNANISFENGSHVILSGNTGINTKTGAWTRFGKNNDENAPIIEIYATKAGILNSNLDGSTKMYVKAHDAFSNVAGNLHLTKGSIIEGNIDSYSQNRNFTLQLDEGTKIFADEEIKLSNFQTKGDLYIGPRSAYEKVDGHAGASNMVARLSKMTDEEIKQLLVDDKKLEESGLDGVSGASYILMDSLKKSKEALRDEIRDLYAKIKSGEINHATDDEYHNLKLQQGSFSFDSGQIHFRVGDEKKLANSNLKTTHDTLIIDDSSKLENLNTKVVLHANNEKSIRKNNDYNVIIEKKKIGNENFELLDTKINSLDYSDVELGAYVFEGKIETDIKRLIDVDKLILDKKQNNTYINNLKNQFNNGKNEDNKKILKLSDYDDDEYSKPVNEMYNKAFSNFLTERGYAFKEGFDLSATRFNPERHIIDIKTGETLSYSEARKLQKEIEKNENEILGNAKINGDFPFYDEEDYITKNINHSKDILEAINKNKALANEFNIAQLIYKGTDRLSKAAQKEFDNSFNRDKNSIFTINSISDGIYDNKSLDANEIQNAWLVNGNTTLKNKKTKDKLKENIIVGGYDYKIFNNTSIGFTLAKTNGDYDGISYGIYTNYKFATLFFSHSQFKKEHKYNESNLGLMFGQKFTFNRFYLEPKIKGIFRKTDSLKYSTDKMDVKLGKNNSIYTEGTLVTGYETSLYNLYLKYSIAKDYGNNYKVIFNNDLSKKANNESLIQNFAAGCSIQLLSSTSLDTQINKEFSKKYNSNINFKIGLKYTY